MTTLPPVLLLAGGRGTRMGGGDKCLRLLAGRPLLAHVLERMAPQAGRVLLNANGDAARFAGFGLAVLADTLPDHPGPLAGVLAGMEFLAAHAPGVDAFVTVPTDTPFLPRDLVARLLAARAAGAEVAWAASGGRAHPVAAIWPVRLAARLRADMTQHGERRLHAWAARFAFAEVMFPAVMSPAGPVDPFFNANDPQDLARAEALLSML